jgi:hypothetical protein
MCERTRDKVNYRHRRETQNKIHNIINPQRKTHEKKNKNESRPESKRVTNKHISTSTAMPRKN